MDERKVSIIQPKNKLQFNKDNPSVPIKRRVCAYARVSTDNNEQKTSYAAQIDEYTTKINNNDKWEFCGMYADEGISGTSTKRRVEFNRMISDAKNGKLDLILVKSISRFARNTVDCLQHIRELKSYGVEVFFEKDNLWSFDNNTEVILTMLATFAQEEARSISENVKWSVRKRFRDGVPIINHSRLLGYTKDKKGGNLVIVPEEAETVKLIFSLYTKGIGPQEICKRLMGKGLKTGANKTIWRQATVIKILKNEKYVGDLEQQKTITLDFLSHRKVRNIDIAPKYYSKDNHEAIIDRKTFELAQHIIKDRANSKMGANKDSTKYNNRYPLSSMVVCAHCGRSLKRRYWNYGTPAQKVMLQCGGYLEGKGNCDAKALTNDAVERTTAHVIDSLFMQDTSFIDLLFRITNNAISVGAAEDVLIEKRELIIAIENEIESLIDLHLKTPIPQDVFNRKLSEVNDRLIIAKNELKKMEDSFIKGHEAKERLDTINKILKENKDGIKVITNNLIKAFIQKIISVGPDEIVFCMMSNRTYTDQTFAENIDKFLSHPPITEGIFDDPIYPIKIKFKVIIP